MSNNKTNLRLGIFTLNVVCCELFLVCHIVTRTNKKYWTHIYIFTLQDCGLVKHIVQTVGQIQLIELDVTFTKKESLACYDLNSAERLTINCIKSSMTLQILIQIKQI